MSPAAQYEALLAWCRGKGRLSVAFSGGADSSLLIRAASEALGENALALTARAAMLARREAEDAVRFAQDCGIKHEWVELDVAAVPHFFENPRDRCYHCKMAIMSALLARAEACDRLPLCEGSNLDDLGDVRPGRRAIEELGVASPFLDLGIGKAEIHAIARLLALPSADKPSFACLASRVPYDTPITIAMLRQIDEAEDALLALGFAQRRVRHHGSIARIELPEADMPHALAHAKAIESALQDLGFAYVCLDLGGFVTGKLNRS